MIKYYDGILWLIFMIWIYVMMDDEEMMWDDDVWNYICGFILCWYCDEMIWNVVKMNCGNDEMIEVDDMNLGVFVSSYIYITSIITYIYMKTLEL